MNAATTTVVYLCHVPYGYTCFLEFIDSYKKFDSGAIHELAVVFKGHNDVQELGDYTRLLEERQISYQQYQYTLDGLDIPTYQWVAAQLSTENVLFLNTRSRILATNWLLIYQSAALSHPKTIISATGSWQSHVSTAFILHPPHYENALGINGNLKKYWLLLKASTLWWFTFPLFPNPHIRTNAFFINRLLFLSLSKPTNVRRKRLAHAFESGRNGLTAQLKKKGYSVGIVGKDGSLSFEKDWPLSKKFYSGKQENLLIADNQTNAYTNGSVEKRKLLRKLTWGKLFG